MTTTNCCEKCVIHLPYKEKNEYQCNNGSCECHTPNPLTAAIEAAKEELTDCYFCALKPEDWGEPCSGDEHQANYKTFHWFKQKMQQAHALGKQEGMDEGAASAVRYVQKNILSIDTNDINAPTLQVSTEKLEELLEAARTAHNENNL